MLKKSVVFGLTLLMILTLIPSSLSAEENQEKNGKGFKQGNIEFSEKEIQKLDQYVTLDEENLLYSVKDKAKSELHGKEYGQLKAAVNRANKSIKNTPEASRKNVHAPGQQTEEPEVGLFYTEGKNDVDFHWWGYRVYLSKSTVNAISGGAAIGGIWIPEPVVSKVLATLGVAGTFIPGGIRFDVSYITPMAPSNIGFQ